MYENLALLRTAHAMARHAGNRQAVVARNLANADTPGYRAQAIAPFAETFDAAPAGAMRATRPGHAASAPGFAAGDIDFSDAEPAPNGNSVSVELEMVHAANVEREHDRALSVYRHTLTVLRSVINGR